MEVSLYWNRKWVSAWDFYLDVLLFLMSFWAYNFQPWVMFQNANTNLSSVLPFKAKKSFCYFTEEGWSFTFFCRIESLFKKVKKQWKKLGNWWVSTRAGKRRKLRYVKQFLFSKWNALFIYMYLFIYIWDHWPKTTKGGRFAEVVTYERSQDSDLNDRKRFSIIVA